MTHFKKSIAFLIVIATILSAFISVPASTVYAAGTKTPFYKWKQYDPEWKDVYIGNNTIGNIGCYVTSAAMLIVYSGLRTEANFDPATLVYDLKEVGGFSGNLIYKGKINKAVTGFDYQSEVLLGQTKAEKTETISYYLNKGYYLIAGVKNLGHYVAIREVKNGVVYMMDPASESTVLFDYYSVSGVTKIFLYTSTGKKVSIDDNLDNNSSGSTSQYKNGVYKTTTDLNLRASATTSSSALLIIPKGTELTITETEGIWGKTSYGGKTGYISLEYATWVSDGVKDPYDASSEDTSKEETSKEETSKDDTTSEDTSTTTPQYVPGRYSMTGNVYLREGPDSSYKVLTTIPKGSEVVITETTGKWGKTSYGGYNGYCGLSYSKLIEAAKEEEKEETKNETSVSITTQGTNRWTSSATSASYHKGYYTTTSNLNLRESNSTTATKLAVIPSGTELKITEVKNGWGKAVYNQITGWCSLEYCKFKEPYLEKNVFSATKITGVLSSKADLSNLYFEKHYSDGSVYLVKSGISVSYTIPTTPSAITATAKFESKSYSFKILYAANCEFELHDGTLYAITELGRTAKEVFGDTTVQMKTGATNILSGIPFTVIMVGDVDGTKEITSTDYLKVKGTFLGSINTDKVMSLASDYDRNGKITSSDYLALKAILTK